MIAQFVLHAPRGKTIARTGVDFFSKIEWFVFVFEDACLIRNFRHPL